MVPLKCETCETFPIIACPTKPVRQADPITWTLIFLQGPRCKAYLTSAPYVDIEGC